MPESSAVVKETVLEADLGPAPIEPADVVEGEPVGESHVMRLSDDKRLSAGVWQCSPGRFYLPHNYEETVTILQGHATVTPEGGEAVELNAGDTAFFPSGTRVLWEVDQTVRKSWHIWDETGTLFG